MDYKELAERLKCPQIRECPIKGKQPSCGKCQKDISKTAADAITDLLKYKDAIDRMGFFGTLFVMYAGDPRGPIGRCGDKSLEEEAETMPVITDVDGGRWRTVNENVLRDLIARMQEAEARCKALEERADRWEAEVNAYSESDLAKAHEALSEDWAKWKLRAKELETRLETAEKMVKEYQDVIIPGYRERAEKAAREAKEAQREATICRNGWKKAETDRDAALDLIGWIYYEACVSVEHDMRQHLDWLKEKIEKWRGERKK